MRTTGEWTRGEHRLGVAVRRAVVMVAAATWAWPSGAVAAPTATVTGVFSDSCRDVEVASSKDISHVEITYADGRVVKDEIIDSPHYSIDGAAGDEIDFVIVKAGTTRDPIHCARTPVAACSDGLDNDGDLLIDYPTDPQCTSWEGIDEGLDNGDGLD